MTSAVKPIPDAYRGATPYICCKGAAQALDFYKRAFSAVEILRMDAPGGSIAHAEFRIGDAIVMIADEHHEMQFLSPQTIGGTPVILYVYVEDVDALARRAEEAGATILRPPEDQFYGDRSCSLEDPFGHRWGFATHIEDVSQEEVERRAREKFGGG